MEKGSSNYNQIVSFARELPFELKKQFGWSSFYTKEQVRLAILETFTFLGNTNDWSFENVCYAFAMYCTPHEFEDFQVEYNERRNYIELRKDITEICFDNHLEFTFSDLEEFASHDSSSSTSELGDAFSDAGVGD